MRGEVVGWSRWLGEVGMVCMFRGVCTLHIGSELYVQGLGRCGSASRVLGCDGEVGSGCRFV